MRAISLCLLAVLILPAQVTAETIYRCKLKSGKVSIQNQPCQPGTEVGIRQYQTPRFDPQAEARLRRLEAAQRSRSIHARPQGYQSYSSYGDAARSKYDQKRANCQAAKAYRASTLERVGLRRNFDLLRSLDDQVDRACNGQ